MKTGLAELIFSTDYYDHVFILLQFLKILNYAFPVLELFLNSWIKTYLVTLVL